VWILQILEGRDQKAGAGNSFRLFIFRFEIGEGSAPGRYVSEPRRPPWVLRGVLLATRHSFW
jgi:hypothetical protein